MSPAVHLGRSQRNTQKGDQGKPDLDFDEPAFVLRRLVYEAGGVLEVLIAKYGRSVALYGTHEDA